MDDLMTAEEFAKSQDPPVSTRWITRMCSEGRIKDATRLGTGKTASWIIRRGTVIKRNRRGRPSKVA